MKRATLSLLAACLMAAGAAQAGTPAVTVNPGSKAGTQGAGGVINFSGEITDVSCEVEAGSQKQDIDLGKWAASYFTTNQETTPTRFTIDVKGCPDSVSKVAVLFDGSKDPNDTTLLQLTPGGASGVGIILHEADRNQSINIGTISKAVQLDSTEQGGEATLEFYADYKADGAQITPGKANAVSSFVMVYN